MASVVLGAVGSVIGGPVGGALGALVGGYIDQNFLLPALFPPQAIEGARLNELKIQGADEGQPANFIIGGKARVAGAIIWISDIVEVRNDEDDGGGKGGGGGSGGAQASAPYLYFVDMAIGLAMQPNATLQKIFCEGKLLYNANPDVAISSALLTVSVLGLGSRRRMKVASPVGGPDLSTLVVGYVATISGCSNGANNGVFDVTSVSRDRATGSSYAVFRNHSCVAEAAGATIAISQDLPPYDPKKVQELTFYSGAASQSPDPLIQAYEGAANTPGFSGTAYVVLKQLALADYGNRVPQLGALVDVGGATVALALEACWTRSGRSSGEISTSGIAGEMEGYAVTGPFAPINALQPLALAYDVVSQESSGAVRFFHRKNAQIVEVDEIDLAAHEYGGDASRPLDVDDDPKSEGPSEANVKHVDLEAENQAGSQRERRRDYASDGVVNVDLPIAMTGAKARGIARRLLWVAWANRKKFKLRLPPRYLHVQENDCLRLKALGESWLLLVQRVDFGANGVILIEAVLEVRDVLTQVEEADLPYTGSTSLSAEASDVEAIVTEGPPITPSGGDLPGNPVLTTATCIEDPLVPFSGVVVYESPDDDEYEAFQTITREAVMGYATTVLAGGVSTAYWDRVSTVDVYLFSGTIESRVELDVLNGANRALLGTEIIGFATASLVATGTYRLSNLLRGLRNTEDQIATHATSESFGLLDSGVHSKAFPLSWIGSTRSFRFVFAGQTLDDATTRSLAITGKTLKPFSPASIGVVKDGATGAVTVTIRRRTRTVMRLFSTALAPISEESERYSVDVVYPAGGGTIKRTIAVDATNVFVYTEAQQIADGVTAFADVEYRLHQLSAIVGRGKALIVTA